MLPIQFSEEEALLLHLLLKSRLSALNVEIEHTDAREYREMLKGQRVALENILSRVPAPTGGPRR